MNIKCIKYIGSLLFAALTLTACSPDDYSGATGTSRDASNYDDLITVTVDQATNYVSFKYNAKDGTSPVWVLDNGTSFRSDFNFNKMYWRAGTYTIECKIMDADGISDNSVSKTFTVGQTRIDGFGGFSELSEYNLAKGATASIDHFWYAPGWAQIADPVYRNTGLDYYVTLPKETTDPWQAQMFVNTDIKLSSDKTYDFSVILTSTTDHPHVTVQLGGGSLFHKDGIPLKKDTPTCIYATELQGIDTDGLPLVFDFGGCKENTTVSIECFVIKEHDKDDGTVIPVITEPEWPALDSEQNLWHGLTITPTFYYAPGWNQIDDPVLTQNGTVYSLNLPVSTYEKWQAQVSLNSNYRVASTDVKYDFNAHLKADKDCNVTVKLVQTDIFDPETGDKLVDNGGNAFFEETVSLKAGEDYNFWKAQMKAPKPMHAVTLLFDFGTNPDDLNVEISNIILQQSAEQ